VAGCSTRITNAYFADLKASGSPPEEIDAIRRYGTPVLQHRIETQATRAALAGLSALARSRAIAASRLWLLGGRSIFPA